MRQLGLGLLIDRQSDLIEFSPQEVID